ncbi:MAG: serine/threonine protein kinase, partial [Planctomycetota bacterium]
MHDYRHYVGKVLDQLKLERVLGVGGSGAVFLARHQIMDTQVAVKILPPHLAVDDMYKERFFREAREVSRMDHPNIVKVSWMGESDGLLFLSMEYMGGGNIGDIVERDGRIPVEEAIRLLVPVAEGLHYAHERGLVHRDIKPDNLLLTAADPPVAKIADFGLVRNLMGGDGQQNITRTGEAIGTPAFMPLEQWDGMEIDRRADLYALGVTFYYCVSGRLPIDEEGISAIVSRLLTGSQTPLTKVCPDADDALWAIIQKSIAPQRNHRMATAQEFADRLRDWLKKRQSAPVAPAAANANVVVPPPPMPVAVPAAVSNAVEEEPGVQTLPRRGRGTIGRQSAGTGSRVPGSSPMVGSGSGHGGGAGVIPPAPVARPSSDARGGGQARTRRAAGTASQSPDDWHDSNNAANAANSGGQRRSPQARSVGTSSQAPDDWNDSGSVPGGMNRHTLEQQKQAAIAASVPGAGAARTREIAKPGARDRGTERPTRGAMAGAGTRRATAPARGSRAARRPSDAGGQATSKVPLIIGGIIVVGLIAVVALVMGASGSPQSSTNTNTDGTNTPGNQTPGNTNATASNGNVPGNTTSNASNGTNSSNASNGNSAVSDVQKLIDRASRVNNPRTAKEMLRDIDDAIAKNPSWKTQLAATRLNLRRMELLPDVNDLRASIGIVGDDPRKASNVLRQLDDFLAANPDVPDLADMFTADRKHLQELAATAETPPDPGPGPGPSGDALPAPDPALKGPHADAVRIEVGKAITSGFKPMQEYWFGFEVT